MRRDVVTLLLSLSLLVSCGQGVSTSLGPSSQDIGSASSEGDLPHHLASSSEDTTPLYGDYVVIKAPTCEEPGLEERTCLRGSCAVETREVPPLGHDYRFDSFVWAEDYSAKAKYVCAHDADHVCYYDAVVRSQITLAPTPYIEGKRVHTASYEDHVDTKEEILPKLTWGEWETTIEPTCEEGGSQERHCVEDPSYEETKEIPAHGHNYVFVGFEWNDDYTAKAKCVCSYDETHIAYFDAEMSNKVKVAATCDAPGIIVYTATYAGNSESKEIIVDPHHFVDGVCTECGQPAPSEGIEYEDDDAGTGLAVIGYHGESPDLIIPSYIEGKPITTLGGKYQMGIDAVINGKEYIRKVVIPNTVTTIRSSAFYNTLSLVSVTLGTGVTSIGSGAFGLCHKLVEVYNFSSLPIEKGASTYGGLGSYARDIYTMPDAHSKIEYREDGFIFYRDNDEVDLLRKEGASSNLVIPDGVTSIHERAFIFDWSLLSVTIPQSVVSIGDSAFAMCYKLFEICNLSTLNIVAGSTDNGKIGQYAKAVHNTAAYTSIFAKDAAGFVTYLDDDTTLLMAYEGDEGEVKLPSVINKVHSYALAGNPAIIRLVLNEGLTEIGSEAFIHCANMVSISISASVTRIMSAFSAARFHPSFIEATFLDPDGWNVEGSGPIDKEILQDRASAAAKLLVLGRKTWTKSAGLA